MKEVLLIFAGIFYPAKINVRITLCRSTLKFKLLSNIESTLYISSKCRNNVVIFNVEFYNADQRRKNFLNMTECKKFKNKTQNQ